MTRKGVAMVERNDGKQADGPVESGRVVSASSSVELRLGNRVECVRQNAEGLDVSYRGAMHNGLEAVAEVDGEVARRRLMGSPPQNEEGMIECCRVLVRQLRKQGFEWEDPEEATGGGGSAIDATARHRLNRDEPLRIQHTRVTLDSMEALRAERQVVDSHSFDDLLDAVRRVAQKKADRYPADDKISITLALDVTAHPALALSDFIERARNESDYFAGLGFLSVWIVGPTVDLVYRIDTPKT